METQTKTSSEQIVAEDAIEAIKKAYTEKKGPNAKKEPEVTTSDVPTSDPTGLPPSIFAKRSFFQENCQVEASKKARFDDPEDPEGDGAYDHQKGEHHFKNAQPHLPATKPSEADTLTYKQKEEQVNAVIASTADETPPTSPTELRTESERDQTHPSVDAISTEPPPSTTNISMKKSD
ncbi:hypothetical protein L6452_05601 [Arctium lappa]|uniref:Uncharacterized protein n=1 Tax=Arctium lappa TaxID=4217 RepID=A0ACB9EGK5_ARCLA|nr:hypothetical protein L6452_05601 [Arctium lappa]